MNPHSAITTEPEDYPACARCGQFDAVEMGGQWLCLDCVALAGCGCAGHGGSED